MKVIFKLCLVVVALACMTQADPLFKILKVVLGLIAGLLGIVIGLVKLLLSALGGRGGLGNKGICVAFLLNILE